MVADRLGHADASFTLKVYTHVYDDQRVAAALPLSELLNTAAAPGAAALPPAGPERQAGMDALKELHGALGRFLKNAPDWARKSLTELIRSTE